MDEESEDPSIDDSNVEEKWALELYESPAKQKIAEFLGVQHFTDGRVGYDPESACDFAHILAEMDFEDSCEHQENWIFFESRNRISEASEDWKSEIDQDLLKKTHNVVFLFLQMVRTDYCHLAKFSVN